MSHFDTHGFIQAGFKCLDTCAIAVPSQDVQHALCDTDAPIAAELQSYYCDDAVDYSGDNLFIGSEEQIVLHFDCFEILRCIEKRRMVQCNEVHIAVKNWSPHPEVLRSLH